MPPRTEQHGRRGLPATMALGALALVGTPLAAQDLPLQRDYPGAGPFECPVPEVPAIPTQAQLAQAGQLSSDASQAVILGDLERAENLLARAAEVDRSSADLAYRHARVLDDLDRLDEAMLAFCRSLALNTGSSDIDDAAERLDDLYERVRERIPVAAREAFVAGLVQADSRLYQGAVAAFTAAIDAAPDWGAPVYNRAVMYEYMGRIAESLADYRLYLDLAPTAVDPVVVMVSERIGLLEAAATAATPSPAGAVALGVVPGMGHYYTGRPVGGTVVLVTALGAIATGFFVKDVTVECQIPVPAGDSCPAGQVVGEITERPLMLPAIGVAAAVTVVGAVEALIRARSRRSEAEAIAGEIVADGWKLRAPSVTARGAGVDLNLLSLSFR